MRPEAGRALASAVVRRPWLLPVAASEVLRMAPRGWWRRWPPLPLPDLALWRFRMETAYGGRGDSVPSARDIGAFLEWCGAAHDWRSG